MFLEMEKTPMLIFGKLKLVGIGRNLEAFYLKGKRNILEVMHISQKEIMTMSLISNKRERK
jgi:hypothetical protein